MKKKLYINDTTFYQCISSNGDGFVIYFIDSLNINLFRICVVYLKSVSG